MSKNDSELFNKIREDLKKSIKSPLLLEINYKDLKKIQNDFKLNTLEKCSTQIIELASEYYDKSLKDSTNYTNVLEINNVVGTDTILIYDELMNHLEEKIKRDLKLDIAKNIIDATVTFGLKKFGFDIINSLSSGYASQIITNTTSMLVENLDMLQDHISEKYIQELMEYPFEKSSERILDDVTDLTKLSDPQKENDDVDKKLFISSSAKDALRSAYNEFSEVTFSQALRLLLDLIVLTATDSPKLIIIRNPLKLDMVSLSIISQYFALVKDANKKAPIVSFLFIYENNMLLSELREDQNAYNSVYHKKEFLNEQRLFLQRYRFLEQPSTNIPIQAINSNIFVGRSKEIEKLSERAIAFKEFCKNKYDGTNNICMIDLIRAEPGIGKTALYNQHTKTFFHSESINKVEKAERQLILKLSIYNDNAISGASTGLVSFSDSLVKEYKRLEKIYISNFTWRNKISKQIEKKLPDVVMDQFADDISKIKKIGESILKSSFVKNNINNLSNRLKDSDSSIKQQKNEEIYFQDLINKLTGLKKLLNIINNETNYPILLFIDDIHWLDNQCAKFLITKLIKYNNIHIIATTRISDTNSRYKFHYQDTINNAYILAFFRRLNLIDEHFFLHNTKADNQKDIENLVSNMNYDLESNELEGFDTLLLTELIEKVIENNDKDNTWYLAQKIIEFLSDSNTKEDNKIVTLFAIELVNIFCDKSFYLDDNNKKINGISPIIEEKNKVFYFINSEKQIFRKNINKVFNHLLSKVETTASFTTSNNNEHKSNILNLASFAILEERLRLLSMYFGKDHGEAVIQYILFSSILGSPFDRNIVKELMQKVMESDNYLLRPLQIKLKDQNSLKKNDFGLLENIYQIIYRLVELETQYIYSHALLGIFLESKMDYFFDSCYTEDNQIKHNAKNVFYQLLNEFIHTNYPVSHQVENIYKDIYASKMNLRILEKAYYHDKKTFVDIYSNKLSGLALLYKNNNEYTEAIRLQVVNQKIIEPLYLKDEIQYFDVYVEILSNLENYYSFISHYSDALSIVLEECSIRREKYRKETNSIEKTRKYIESLITVAKYFSEDLGEKSLSTLEDKYNLGLDYLIKAYDIVYPLYKLNHKEWIDEYFNTLVSFYEYYPMYYNSQKYFNICCDISKKGYDSNSALWQIPYLNTLRISAEIYENQYLYDNALDIRREILEILQKGTTNNNVKDIDLLYYHALVSFGQTYKLKADHETGEEAHINYSHAINKFTTARDILGDVELEGIHIEARLYRLIIRRLYETYIDMDNQKKALELKKEYDESTEHFKSNFMDEDKLEQHNLNIAFEEYNKYLLELGHIVDSIGQAVKKAYSQKFSVKLKRYLFNLWDKLSKK